MQSSTLYHQFLTLKGIATLSYSDSQTQTYPHQNAMSFLACCFAVLLFYRAGATEARLAWLRIRHASGIQAEAARFCHYLKFYGLKNTYTGKSILSSTLRSQRQPAPKGCPVWGWSGAFRGKLRPAIWMICSPQPSGLPLRKHSLGCWGHMFLL